MYSYTYKSQLHFSVEEPYQKLRLKDPTMLRLEFVLKKDYNAQIVYTVTYRTYLEGVLGIGLALSIIQGFGTFLQWVTRKVYESDLVN